jgi:hypothetical protein
MTERRLAAVVVADEVIEQSRQVRCGSNATF